MKITIGILVLVLTTAAFPQEKKCLAVYPISGNRLQGLAAGAYVGLALSHGERYGYIESTGMGIHDTKPQYKKKELEKLESNGIKIIVTTEPVVNVNGKEHRAGSDRNNRDTDVSAVAELSAGCKVITPAVPVAAAPDPAPVAPVAVAPMPHPQPLLERQEAAHAVTPAPQSVVQSAVQQQAAPKVIVQRAEAPKVCLEEMTYSNGASVCTKYAETALKADR